MRVNNWKKIILPIFLMLFSLLFDGFIASYFTSALSTDIGWMTPRTLVLVIIILSFHYEQRFMSISVAIIGFLMDAYYIGFLGTYMAAFLLVVTIVANIKKFIQANVLSYTLVSILGLTVNEIVVYSIMRMLSLTTITFQDFIVTHLSATLLFNVVVMLIISYFIDRLIVYTLNEAEVR